MVQLLVMLVFGNVYKNFDNHLPTFPTIPVEPTIAPEAELQATLFQLIFFELK